ncbi:MAG: M24 family metallopeptidase [Culicoidibacterales bacterium]
MKIKQIKEWMTNNNIDICFINSPENISYLTEYHSDPHERILALIISREAGADFLFTPALEVEDAKKIVNDLPVFGYLDHQNPWELIKKKITEKMKATTNWAIEEDFLTIGKYNALKANFKQSLFMVDITPKIAEMMVIKTPPEIAKMIKAGAMADFAFTVGFKALKEGITEQEVIAEIEYELKKKGVMEMSFRTLVLFGDHCASPHGTPSARKLQKGELVLFDLGTVVDGYTSDATRMASFGTPTAHQQEIYDIVLSAHNEAINQIKPGITAGSLDKAARDVINNAGLGEYFNHRLGHGLGSSVHQYPSIMEGNELIIEAGMCFSIEPGIYIPDSIGVRIEDCVYVTENGYEVLTRTSKNLYIVK